MFLLQIIFLIKSIVSSGYFCLADVYLPTESEQKYCTEDQTEGSSGYIISPGYPDRYLNDINYTRIISFRESTTSVNFTIIDLDSETKTVLECFDYLEIERVDTTPCCNRLFKGCRNYSNSTSVMADGKQFRISFITDSSVTKRGFKLFWQASDSIDREQRYYTKQTTGKNGEITSLEYPCNYSNNVNYTWIIKTGDNKTSVNFTILDLQAETNGIWSCIDYLQIERVNPCCIRLTKGCRNLAYSIVTTGERFRVSFISNSAINKKGFRLSWQAVAPIPGESDMKRCIDYDSSGKLQINSPGYPGNYPNNVNYTWVVTTRNNKTSVNFSIVDLQAESNGEQSCFDYLKIERKDVVPCCSILFKGCRNPKDSIVAVGKQFRVSFVTDNLVSRKGLKLYFQANDSIQLEHRYYTEYLDSDNGQITSPGYPCNYPNNVNYTWIIKTSNNKNSVNFHIVDLQAETMGALSCYDYLKIDRVKPCCVSLTKECRNLTYSIAAEGDQFRVSFISDGSSTRKGLRLFWNVFAPWKTRNFQETQPSNVLSITTAYNRTDAKISDNESTGISSLYGVLFLVMSGIVSALLVVIVCIVIYFKKEIQRKCFQPPLDIVVNESYSMYENTVMQSNARGTQRNNCHDNPTGEDMELYEELKY